MNCGLLNRSLLASCSRIGSQTTSLPLWEEQRRWKGGRPGGYRKPKFTWTRDLLPLQDREALSKPLPPDDPMRSRFLKIEAARADGTLTAYRDPFIMRFTNIIMKQGKKDLARRLIDETLERVKRHQVKLWLAAPPEERDKIECNPRVIFREAVKNASPLLQLRPVMKGGVEYQVPRDVSPRMAEFRALQWFRDTCREIRLNPDREEAQVPRDVSPRMAEFRALQWFRDTCREKWIDVKMHYPENLAKEIIAAYNNEGRVIAIKRELHKTCEANRAYAHYR